MMEELRMIEVINGLRTLTNDERQWAIDQHCFLSEFVRSDDPEKLTDKQLIREVKDASYEYVINTFN